MIFFEKIHRNKIFSSNSLKRLSFQKGPRWHIIFLVLFEKMVFFPPKTWYFFPGQKARGGPSQEIHGNITFLYTRTGVANVAPRPSVKKIKDGLIPQKYTKGWLTIWINILERAPAILCTFTETFTGVFMHCSQARRKQET